MSDDVTGNTVGPTPAPTGPGPHTRLFFTMMSAGILSLAALSSFWPRGEAPLALGGISIIAYIPAGFLSASEAAKILEAFRGGK